VAGSSPVFRSKKSLPATADRVFKSCCSSGVEHFLGKEEVVSSILINSSKEYLKSCVNNFYKNV
jgi:hypothetical protein